MKKSNFLIGFAILFTFFAPFIFTLNGPEFLEKNVEANSPYRYGVGSFGDDKIIEVSNGEIVGEYEGKL